MASAEPTFEAPLVELRRRIGALEGEVFDEGETVCCYHASDKTWVTDAQGVSWETFFTSGEADVMKAGDAADGGVSAAAAGDGCCAPDCCS